MSEGAQAARADLARLRKDNNDDTPKLDPQIKKAAIRVFQAGDALINAIRTYSADHPSLEKSIESIVEKLTAFWADHGDLVVKLEPRAVTILGEAVAEAERAEDNIWFPLFSAGIRQLQFLPGTTGAELRTLFSIVNKFRQGSDDAYDEDDPVTMMWVAELEHIKYIAVDSFSTLVENPDSDKAKELHHLAGMAMMADLSFATLAGESYCKGELARRVHTITLTTADLEFLREENLASLSEFLPDKARRNDLTKIIAAQRQVLAQGCSELPEPVARWVEALLFSINSVTDEELKRELNDLLCERFGITLSDNEFMLALRIMRSLERNEALARSAMTPLNTRRITSSFIAAADDDSRKIVNALLPYCGFQPLAFLETVGEAQQDEARAYLLRGATMWKANTATAVADLIARVQPNYAVELCEMVSSIEDPTAMAALEKAFDHEFFRVRDRAARTIFAKDRARAVPLAKRALDDAHSLVRAAAIDYFTQAKPPNSGGLLKSRIEAPDFDSLELVEKQRLYRALAAVGGADARTWLKMKLCQKNPLRRQSIDDERIAAASALAFLKDQSARADIEKLATSRFLRDEVREAAKRALHALTTNRPEELKS